MIGIKLFATRLSYQSLLDWSPEIGVNDVKRELKISRLNFGEPQSVIFVTNSADCTQ